MNRDVVALILSAFVLVSACSPAGEGLRTMVEPTSLPTPAPPAPSPPRRFISIGETIQDALTVHGSHKAYDLTAPSDGLLVAQVSWNSEQGYLELWIEDTPFAGSSSSAVGRLSVSAGQTYRSRVFDGSPWDYDDLFVRFVLTTSME